MVNSRSADSAKVPGVPCQRFAYQRPMAFIIGMFLGSAIASVSLVAFVNGWFTFSLADLFELMEGRPPVSTGVLNAGLAVFTVAWFLGLAALVPHEVRVGEDGLVFVRLLGERKVAKEEIVGASISPLGYALVHAGRLVFLLLPLFDEMEELEAVLKEVVSRRRR